MIQSNPVVYSADDFTVGLRLVLIDEDEVGIKKVKVYDRYRALINDTSFENCPITETIDLGTIERSRFPIFVEAIDCNDRTSPPDIPLDFIPSGTEGPGIMLPCSPTVCFPNPRCDEASGQALNARNAILEICDRLRALRQERNTWASVAATAFATAVAFAAAAISAIGAGGLFGVIVAAVLLIGAAAAIGVAIAATVKARYIEVRIQRVERELEEARRLFSEAAVAANSACCPGCIDVGLIQPEC